jgi:hypothetical protein
MLRQKLDKQGTTVRTGYRRPAMRRGQTFVNTIQLTLTDSDTRIAATFHDRLILCPLRKNRTVWSTTNSNTSRSTTNQSRSGITIKKRPTDLEGQEHDNHVTLRKRCSTWQTTTKCVLVVFEPLIMSFKSSFNICHFNKSRNCVPASACRRLDSDTARQLPTTVVG